MSPSQPYISTGPVGADGVVKCHGHGLPAELHKSQYMNRKYYRCAVHKVNKCNFIQWADSLVIKQNVPSSSTNTTLRPSRTNLPTTNSPTLQSSQGSSSTMDSEYDGMTPSEKRLAIMTKALAGPPDTIKSPSTPAARHLSADVKPNVDMRRPPSVIQTHMRYPPTPTPTQPRSSVGRDEDEFDDFEGINDDVFASLPATPNQPTSAIDRITLSNPRNRFSDFRFNSAKRPRLSESHDDEFDDARSITAFSLAGSQTPSTHSSGQYVTPMSSPSRTAFRDDLPSQESSPDRSALSDPTSPPSSSPFTSPQAKSDLESSSQSFWAFLGGWRVIEEYAKKLERKNLALEKGNDFKTKKIAEQKKEIESLRARLRALEEENNLSKARWR